MGLEIIRVITTVRQYANPFKYLLASIFHRSWRTLRLSRPYYLKMYDLENIV